MPSPIYTQVKLPWRSEIYVDYDFLISKLFWCRFCLPGFAFFETSAKDNINVKQTFERLVDIICDKMSESLETDPAVTTGTQGTARLTENPPPLQQPNCAC